MAPGTPDVSALPAQRLSQATCHSRGAPVPPPCPNPAGKGQLRDPEASRAHPRLCPVPQPPCQSARKPARSQQAWAAPGLTAKGRDSRRWPLCPQQSFLPSVSQAQPLPHPQGRTEVRNGFMKALCSRGPGPGNSGFLGMREPKDSAGFRGAPRQHACTPGAPAIGRLPPRSWVVFAEREGSPPTLSGLLFVSSHPPSSLEEGMPPSPWKRSHSQRAEAAQPSLEKP